MSDLKRILLTVLTAALMAACGQNRDTPYRVAPRPALPGVGAVSVGVGLNRSNTDIAEDFLDLVFALENGATLETLSKFPGPVRVAVASDHLMDHEPFLDAFLKRLRNEAEIDIARAPVAGANLFVRLAPAHRMAKRLSSAYCIVVPGDVTWDDLEREAEQRRLIGWTHIETIETATVLIPSNASPFEVRLCLMEEITQALGPGNDLYRLSDSIFNDDNAHVRPTAFDMLILRALYHPRIEIGMTRTAARAPLMGVLDDLNPRGRNLPARKGLAPSDPWRQAVLLLHARSTAEDVKLAYAARAASLADEFSERDPRRGYSFDLLGQQLLMEDSAQEALHYLDRAIIEYAAALGPGDIRVASARLPRARALLDLNRAADALTELELAEPVIVAHEAEARLTHLYNLRFEGLRAIGDARGSVEAALASLNWGLYTFGADYGEIAQTRDFYALLHNARLPKPN